jgi:DNA-binding transcriptional MocR family regulator
METNALMSNRLRGAETAARGKGANPDANTGTHTATDTGKGINTARRIGRLTSSPVREILSVANRADIISFAGGLPDHESFPDIALNDVDKGVLQYGATEGDARLRQWIADDLARRNFAVSAEQVLILSGSQQGIDLVAKMFLEPHTRIAVESPTYLAALQVFNLFGADAICFAPDTVAKLKNEQPVITYTIPTFQNPTGYCYSAAERQQLAAICDANGSVLFEDDPYRDLVYDPCDRQPVCSYLEQSNWIYQSSFSKTLAPGLRLGYLVCSPSLYPTLSWLKQAADLHSNRLSQLLVLAQLQRADYADRLQHITAGYRRKRDHFDTLLHRYVAGLANWQKPAGGLFFWLKLNKQIDTGKLLEQALEQCVAFMPGEPFFPANAAADGAQQQGSCIRLNFSHSSVEQSETGLKILSELIRAQYG